MLNVIEKEEPVASAGVQRREAASPWFGTGIREVSFHLSGQRQTCCSASDVRRGGLAEKL